MQVLLVDGHHDESLLQQPPRQRPRPPGHVLPALLAARGVGGELLEEEAAGDVEVGSQRLRCHDLHDEAEEEVQCRVVEAALVRQQSRVTSRQLDVVQPQRAGARRAGRPRALERHVGQPPPERGQRNRDLSSIRHQSQLGKEVALLVRPVLAAPAAGLGARRPQQRRGVGRGVHPEDNGASTVSDLCGVDARGRQAEAGPLDQRLHPRGAGAQDSGKHQGELRLVPVPRRRAETALPHDGDAAHEPHAAGAALPGGLTVLHQHAAGETVRGQSALRVGQGGLGCEGRRGWGTAGGLIVRVDSDGVPRPGVRRHWPGGRAGGRATRARPGAALGPPLRP
mmetsp:Transcript_49286/g.118526  ORF Transcript_49286/g.118526 Transcript_49286/m.118526 type:complete len:339 (+) Transcript_49286:622-1638(+)